MLRYLLIPILFCFSFRQTVAAEAPKTGQETQRLLLVTPVRPLIIEAHITLDEQPLAIRRNQLVDEAIQHADTDDDGQATWLEAFKNPRFFTNDSGLMSERLVLHYTKRYDIDRDGIIDREEAHRIVASFGSGPVFDIPQASFSSNRNYLGSIINRGEITTVDQHNIATASQRLMASDINQDGLLRPREVGAGQREWDETLISTTTNREANVFRLGAEIDTKAIHNALQRHENKSRQDDSNTTHVWLKDLMSIDQNNNGKVDQHEIIGLKSLEPHLVLEVNVSSHRESKPTVVLRRLSSAIADDPESHTLINMVQLKFPMLRLRFRSVSDGRKADNTYRARRIMTQYDTDRNRYLTLEEFVKRSGPQSKSQFIRWGRNDDGQVTLDELKEYLRRESLPGKTQVRLIMIERPRLLAAIDANADSRIGKREMASATKRLRSFDRNKDATSTTTNYPSTSRLFSSTGHSEVYSPEILDWVGRT